MSFIPWTSEGVAAGVAAVEGSGAAVEGSGASSPSISWPSLYGMCPKSLVEACVAFGEASEGGLWDSAPVPLVEGSTLPLLHNSLIRTSEQRDQSCNAMDHENHATPIPLLFCPLGRTQSLTRALREGKASDTPRCGCITLSDFSACYLSKPGKTTAYSCPPVRLACSTGLLEVKERLRVMSFIGHLIGHHVQHEQARQVQAFTPSVPTDVCMFPALAEC